ncbi:orotidine-5'-phosphate decarboxylase [Evansella cellulosilytica]|uniref:Orotidine 5'-phosphate decarboxylase n=1 Tax=Evansella cellulosilytica (strain ATCC 21833 / DSM 2522 / FERM P-1141 / JCM 9156 / N-4) TaxID=649639 RepID=E6TTQ2_EVAC2|nr:orotidine-5'-phosphate decarboxylase [Evansella cellulosilytica]ADU30821.1 orotidine 5'-phosphate decarboxylase [Evansella cellulosilytica DSM 2522]
MQQYPLIVALDFPTKEEVNQFLEPFQNQQLFVKVGMELFYREGIPFINELKEKGHQIFLDLKLHDIPTTVKRAMKQLAQLEVDIVNVHAMGGIEMMRAAKEGLIAGTKANGSVPLCIAVTQLTSTSEAVMQNEMKIPFTINDHVLHLCHCVKEAELDGVVCSAQEVRIIRENIPSPFYTLTPGIRRLSDSAHDQQRIVTPQLAAQYGSSAIVVGRGITRSDNPVEAYQLYFNEWSQR